MNILVIGCGHVGAALVRDLETAGHDVSLIEADPENLRHLDEFEGYTFGGTALVGDPTDPDILCRGGIESCDAVAAVSTLDSVNLMAAQVARRMFKKQHVVCRVSDPNLYRIYRDLYDIETVCPTLLTVNEMFSRLDSRQP